MGKVYYYELKDDSLGGEFVAVTDAEARRRGLLTAEKKKDTLLTIYRESDTKDGLPFIVIWPLEV